MNAKNERAVQMGRRIRRIRESRNRMTMKELADKVGVSHGYIRAIEVGAKEVSSLDLAERIAAALNVQPAELTGPDHMSQELQRLREAREAYEAAVSSVGKVHDIGKVTIVDAATDMNDPRVRLFLRRAPDLTDEQWEELLRVLETGDEEVG